MNQQIPMGNQNINLNQMIQQQIQNNPQTKNMMDLQNRVNQMLNGKSPEEQQQVFMNTCKSMGVDPNQFIQQHMPNLQGQNNQMR